MRLEKSSGAIVFRERDTRKYLLLNYGKDYWGFPKGIVEEGESEREAARRELEEETGIRETSFIEGFREEIGYFFRRRGELIRKTVVYFLARAQSDRVTLSFEHIGFAWLEFNKAVQKLTFKNSRRLLEKAEGLLDRSSKKE